jgi:hypothetical protein
LHDHQIKQLLSYLDRIAHALEGINNSLDIIQCVNTIGDKEIAEVQEMNYESVIE